MPCSRQVDRLLAVALGVLVAGGAWMRLTSLGTAPYPNADEAFFGVQAAHLLQGERVAGQTASNNPLNPFLVALELPIVALADPSMPGLRLAAATWGLLAVALMCRLMARVLDRPTAILAAVLLLVLPIAVVHSRIAAEPAHVPLWGVLGLYFAFRGHRAGVLLAVLGGLLAYHTSLMAAPIYLAVLLTQVYLRHRDDPVRRWREPLATAVGAAAIVAPILLLKQDSHGARWTYATYGFGPPDWGLFLTRYRDMMLGLCNGVPAQPSAALSLAFWGVLVALLAAGSVALARGRRWDRLALVLGVVGSAAAYHVALGPGGLHPALTRYGLFLVAPTALAVACLARALLVEPTTPGHAALRRAQVAGLLALGFALLACYKVNHFDIFIAASGGTERSWTLRTEAVEPKQLIARLIARDLRRRADDAPARGVIVTEDWWHYRPIEFAHVWREDVKVGCVERVPAPERERIVREQLGRGAYVVGGEATDRLVRTLYPPDRLRAWPVQVGPHPLSVVYRLRLPQDGDLAAAGPPARR
jgi:hypothetical protein